MTIADSGAVLQPPHSSIDPLSPEQRAALVAHCRQALPWLLPYAENTPLVVSLYPRGLDRSPTFLASLHEDPPPATHAIDVPSQHGTLRYLAFDERSVLWEIRRGAFELYSWTPLERDPERARFARIILAPTSTDGLALAKVAAVHLRTALAKRGLDAAAGIDPNSATLWIPFDDGFGSLQPTSIALLAVNAADGHSHVVSALKQLLADGKAHAAESSAPPASPPNCCRREPSPSTW